LYKDEVYMKVKALRNFSDGQNNKHILNGQIFEVHGIRAEKLLNLKFVKEYEEVEEKPKDAIVEDNNLIEQLGKQLDEQAKTIEIIEIEKVKLADENTMLIGNLKIIEELKEQDEKNKVEIESSTVKIAELVAQLVEANNLKAKAEEELKETKKNLKAFQKTNK